MSVSGISSANGIPYMVDQAINSSGNNGSSNCPVEVKTAIAVELVKDILSEEKATAKAILDTLV